MQITIEWTILLSVISVCIAAVKIILTAIKEHKKKASDESAFSTAVTDKLDNISGDLQELKRDIRDIKNDVSSHAERIAKLEARVDQFAVITRTENAD